MPRLNIDKLPSANEPIVFRLNDKEYVAKEVDDALMNEVLAIGDNSDDSGDSVSAVHMKQLAILTGAPESEFSGVTLRKTSAALSFIMQSVVDAGKRDEARKKLRR